MDMVQLGDRVIIAPDGSEIRELVRAPTASMVHCRLPAGRTSLAVRHRRVSELWYVLSGAGEIWRGGTVVAARPGLSLAIPPGTPFQFRAAPDAALEILITTIPPWPGMDEAERVADHWPPGEP